MPCELLGLCGGSGISLLPDVLDRMLSGRHPPVNRFSSASQCYLPSGVCKLDVTVIPHIVCALGL